MSSYQNRQLWCECQLVAIWNAVRFFGGETPCMGTPEYEEACEEACAIAGGVIGVDQQMDKFKIKAIRGKYRLDWVRSHLPVHFRVFCHRGYHSVLAVEVRRSEVLLTNYAIGRTHWMPWKKLLEISNQRSRPVQYVMR